MVGVHSSPETRRKHRVAIRASICKAASTFTMAFLTPLSSLGPHAKCRVMLDQTEPWIRRRPPVLAGGCRSSVVLWGRETGRTSSRAAEGKSAGFAIRRRKGKRKEEGEGVSFEMSVPSQATSHLEDPETCRKPSTSSVASLQSWS